MLFVLNSAGETNMARPIIEELKDQGTETKVLHFRHNSKSILTEQGVLEDEDFVAAAEARDEVYSKDGPLGPQSILGQRRPLRGR